MGIELRITKGARTGQRERSDKSVVSIGRHPMNDIRFDVEQDLDVSGRHCEIRTLGESHVLVDVGSTNGTYINGEKLTAGRALEVGDIISFGANGPQAEFHLFSGKMPVTAERKPAPTPIGATGRNTKATPRANTEVRIAAAVERQTSALKRMVAAIATIVIGAAIAAVWITQKGAAETRAQLNALLAKNDSLTQAFGEQMSKNITADSALQAWRAENARLAADLRAQQARGGDVSALSARVRDAQALASVVARMDYAAIAAANQKAVTFLMVEFPDGSRSSGTGFNVLSSGLIVTNRHVVQNVEGARATRIAVAFDGTQGEWKRAIIEVVSTTDELAFLRLETAGEYPVVAGVASGLASVPVGSPIAMLGYPLGTGTAGMGGNINSLRPVATLGVGTVSKILDETLQLDAFAAQGSSGSPVFDARGHVVGVIFGGATESGGRIVYAVPAARLAAQMPGDARGILKN
jgi:pSer/pThr/pTyr-binding forkhead associated (FHA) protein/V8-like Glu-specific endopeptidase